MVELNVETASSGGSPRQSLPGSPRQSLRGYRPDAQSPRPSPERKRKQESRALAQARADQRATQEELRVTLQHLIYYQQDRAAVYQKNQALQWRVQKLEKEVAELRAAAQAAAQDRTAQDLAAQNKRLSLALAKARLAAERRQPRGTPSERSVNVETESSAPAVDRREPAPAPVEVRPDVARLLADARDTIRALLPLVEGAGLGPPPPGGWESEMERARSVGSESVGFVVRD